MSDNENDTQSEKKVQSDEPMTLEERAAHYASPGVRKNPKTGKLAQADGGVTPARRRRLRHKENHAIALQVRAAEEKVAKLRGAAKNSAQKTLDRLLRAFK
jgi:hypothetical protein